MNKENILDLPLKDFHLALPFYPHQKAILGAMQADVEAFKSGYYTLSREALGTVAEAIVADWCFDRVAADYLQDGKIGSEWRDYFAVDNANVDTLEIGTYFDTAYRQVVFNRLQSILKTSESYRFTGAALEELGFDKAETEGVFAQLIEAGLMDSEGGIPAEQVDYFLTINHALELELDGFEDYTKDIFFALHAVAKEIDLSRQEIVARLRELAVRQEQAVLDQLAEGFETEADLLRVICRYLLRGAVSTVEAFIAPTLSDIDQFGRIRALPRQHPFNRLWQRIRQFVRLANKLQLSAGDTEIAFSDQDLVDKFPEKLVLPNGMSQFDVLLAGLDDKIYLFKDKQYWVYSADSYELEKAEQSLGQLSNLFAHLERVDAAFVDDMGHGWLVSGTQYFIREKGHDHWKIAERRWGKIDNRFEHAERIQAGFTNRTDHIYLFTGDQYIRYSPERFGTATPTPEVDDGFPRSIDHLWHEEEASQPLPARFAKGVDAAFASPTGQTYLFKDDKFVSSDAYAEEIDIASFWGRVDNRFENLSRVDAAFTHHEHVYLFSGDQVIRYSNAIENADLTIDEGYPQKITSLIPVLPDDFAFGIDAIFFEEEEGDDKKGRIHIAKNSRYAVVSGDFFTLVKEGDLAESWGKIRNNIQLNGNIDAAFTGLDGRSYLFNGDQYVRYSTPDYSRVDEGYPRQIAGAWGGLTSIAAAFVLDGKTYLFSKDKAEYVCYSSNDYTTPDEGYPRPIEQGQWWNLPERLTSTGFVTPDAVLIDQDGRWHLFSGENFVSFDHLHRWWSEPRAIKTKWNGFDANRVDAAFTGKDGKTYLFSHQQYFRYSDSGYHRVDDRYPRQIRDDWGVVVNNVERTRRIDGAVVVESREMVKGDNGTTSPKVTHHTYLFSGNQYFRYANFKYENGGYPDVEEGYPRTLHTGLHQEPRFKNLMAPWTGAIDAAFADQRTVYLFQDDKLHAVSDSPYEAYADRFDKAVSAALLDEGALFIETEDDGWSRINNPEAMTLSPVAELPPLLRDVPTNFQTGLTAVLQGTNQHTYLFNKDSNKDSDKGPECYSVLLKKSYPTREEWGRVRNHITTTNHIDAAFLGLDGRTYLFCGDQFVTYEPDTAGRGGSGIPQYIDGLPRSIEDHWGGLTHVDVAFVRDGKTYLLEKPDEDGYFRYVCYSTDDYTQPDKGFPKIADFDWWGIPAMYREEGFQRVDAVLADDDNLHLIQGQQFIQYNYEEEIWDYPKPLDRIWRGPVFNDDNFQTITTAFTGPDGTVYLFSPEAFVTYDASGASEIHEISSRWGLVKNNITIDGTIDAAFVWDDRETYLFSGDQYVKYSTSDYRFIDPGYPKLIAESLSQEPLFDHLSEALIIERQALTNPQPQHSGVPVNLSAGTGLPPTLSGAIANRGTICLFSGQTVYAISRHNHRTHGLDVVGRVQNRIAQHNRIDAAFVNRRHQVLLFAGDQVFKYSDLRFDAVDEGYPQRIGDALAKEEGFGSAQNIFPYDLDAVVKMPGDDGAVYLFKDKHYVGSDAPAEKKEIGSFWGKVRNNFTPADGETQTALDAAFIAPNGMTYLFKGDQFLRYTRFANEVADEGYPRRIKDHWANLPENYEQAIDGGFVFEGKVYLLKGDEYVRYSRPDLGAMDNIYPQKIVNRWGDWGDYLLSDIRLISWYKHLNETYGGDLTDLLNHQQGGQAAPYEGLHEIFGWDVDEIKWIKRHNCFLTTPNPYGARLNLEMIEKMDRIFAVTGKLGADPEDVYEKLWPHLYPPKVDDGAWKAANFAEAADTLYEYLGTKNSDADWAILSRQIHDELNEFKRDVWMPLVIAQDPDLTGPRDLFARLLIDVEMGSAARTSIIKEAVSALQLYMHRYFVNLEEIDLQTRHPDSTRETLKERWKWLRNYRLWEANRKVFLYPENYIRPELRDTKTPEFQVLEQALLQGELNLETAEAAFTAYLESFSAVSNLKIAGAHVYTDPESGEKVLHLFGHTRLEPLQYYHRTARFAKPDDTSQDPGFIVWTPWEKVDVTINSTRVFPFQTNGRLMVFWIEIADIEEPEAKLKTQEQEDAGTVSEVSIGQNKLRHEARIKYSMLRYDKHWSPAQEIKSKIKIDYEIDAAYYEPEKEQTVTFAGEYVLKTSAERPEGDMKRIEEVNEFKTLPKVFQSGIDAATMFNGKRYLFKGSRCVIQSIDGTILADKPIEQLIVFPEKQDVLVVSAGVFQASHVVRAAPQDNLSLSDGVDAAFEFGQNILTLVDTKGNYSFYKEMPGQAGTNITLQPVKDNQEIELQFPFFPIIISTLVNRSGHFRPADAVFKKDDLLYVLRDGQYECYQADSRDLVQLDGFPKPIRGNLNFNMDQFYNKLNLSDDENGIKISYTSPKHKLFLYGRLKPDFAFQEIPIQEDPALTLVLNWDNLTHGRPHHYRDLRARGIEEYSDTYIDMLNTVKSKLADVSLLKKAHNNIMKAIDDTQKILSNDGDDEKEIIPKNRITDQTRRYNRAHRELSSIDFDKLLEGAEEHNIPDMLARPPESEITLKKDVSNVISSIDKISKWLNKYSDEDREGRNRFRRRLTNEIKKVEKNQKEVDGDLPEVETKVKSLVGQQRDNLKHLVNMTALSTSIQNTNSQVFEDFLNKSQTAIDLLSKNRGPSLDNGVDPKTNILNPFREKNNGIHQHAEDASEALENIGSRLSLDTTSERLDPIIKHLQDLKGLLKERTELLQAMNQSQVAIMEQTSDAVKKEKEKLLGVFELFPDRFGIANTSNFAFSEPNRPDSEPNRPDSEPNRPDWYCFEAQDGAFLCRPLSDTSGTDTPYEVIRLTTTVAPRLSRVLFAQGIKGLLSLVTQQEGERPTFDDQVNPSIAFEAKPFILPHDRDRKPRVPVSKHLDFYGASGIYYEELFFHAPFLIAQTLNAAQKFQEAKMWHEFIFDPTEVKFYWQYLPFGDTSQDENGLTDQGQIKRYLDDPFDPHAIAALRPNAYRKAIVMSYIDNLLDWGDMLFRQYTRESINEARMLYVLAYDLLGDKPENLGTKVLTPDIAVKQLDNTPEHDVVIQTNGQTIGNRLMLEQENSVPVASVTPNDSVAQPYFFVPENGLFRDYWDRVEDRLFKIRHSLNIDGIKQPLPLFQPPIDPMALVRAVAGGASLSQLSTGLNVQVPHYRFEFLVYRAQNLIQKLTQFGGELLAMMEKRDAEALSVMQQQQEATIMRLMINVREAQIDEAEETILSLEASQRHAEDRIDLYKKWLADGMLPEEIHHINLMKAAAVMHFIGSGLKIGSMIANVIPTGKFGPFIVGTESGGRHLGESLSAGAEAAETLGEGLSVTGEILGAEAQHKHMVEDWEVQLMVAESDAEQISHQLAGARLQKQIAQYELAVLEKEIEHNASVQTFFKDKFTNQELYQWLMGKMSGLYFQTYKMAFDMAKMAEKALQFERGWTESEATFINGMYWDSQRKGLLAGESLALDVDRMEQAAIKTHSHRLEISKRISLLELDPRAFLYLKQRGVCEFSLSEALFDYDFPGHYCRQIKTIALEFAITEGVYINATLTQLNHKTVLKPDPKAVKYLLDPRDQPPATIRSNWKANQQIALSYFDQYEKNNGMFELRFDTDRYLPFEGTGAVSMWRLELNGPKGAINLHELRDVTVVVQYTAINEGSGFAEAVKGLLKPYQAMRYFKMTRDFAQPWNAFLGSDDDELVLRFTREHFQNMASSKIAGIVTQYELDEPGRARMVLNGNDDWVLNDNAYVATDGLSIGRSGSELRFEFEGDKQNLRNIQLVFSYKVAVK